MLRLLAFLAAIVAIAIAVTRLAEAPGSFTLNWLGYEIETTAVFALFALLAGLAILWFAWSVVRYVLTRPAALKGYIRHRQEERGLEALSRGLIAVGAGDREEARRYASLAWRRLPDEPLTGLLRAQTAQLRGERGEARRVFEAMAAEPRTELLGLRGLFLEARRENEMEAARQFAERAVAREPELPWGVTALFELQCREGDWEGALKTLDAARRHKHIDRETAERRRAVLLTAQAREAEESDTDRFRALAIEANRLAPGLAPAAELAARALVSQDNTSKAGRVLTRAWELSPHPDLALAYAHLKHGDAPAERLKRVKTLAAMTPENPEGPIAVASAAFEAREWDEARNALQPLLAGDPSARVCTLMARIEGGEHGDRGRVREWLARALRAPRDPVWTADGYVSAEWLPVSPVTGALDAFEWKVPVESASREPLDLGAEELARLTGGGDAASGDGAGLRPDPGAPRASDPASSPDVLVVEAEPAPPPAPREQARPEAPPGEAPSALSGPSAPPQPVAPARPAGQSTGAAFPERDPVLRPAPDAREREEVYAPPRPPDDPGPGGAASELEPENDPWPLRKQ